jgi:hypothetical protein
MYTNKTGAPICVDSEGNVVDCNSPQAAFVAVGQGSSITAEDMKRYKGLPAGDDNAPAEDGDPGDEQVETPQPTTPESKAIVAAPADKMERGADAKGAPKK